MDFLKEISTMKKISLGRCPHVVNMVGCCTLQEPLALVLEYASYGDLLEYLRTMRRVSCLFQTYSISMKSTFYHQMNRIILKRVKSTRI